MFIKASDPAVRYSGRWHREESFAVTTTPGAYAEIAFQGSHAVLHFDLTMNLHPFPHLWLSLDGGARFEVPLDRVIRIEAPSKGNHVLRLLFKGSMEVLNRWQVPLVGKIHFLGMEAEDRGVLPEDTRPVLEFLGDSITEGVLIDGNYKFASPDQFNRPNQDDSTATYAWLTAEMLGCRPVIMGYGGIGVTRGGCGGVPKAALAYPYNMEGSPRLQEKPKAIIVNYGANDLANGEKAYIEQYEGLLKIVRDLNPGIRIIVLSAFRGVFPEALKALVARLNLEWEDDLIFIDSTGWISPEPLHPDRNGHRTVAQYLTPILEEYI